MKWTKKHIISINDFSRDEIDFVLDKSGVMEKKLSSGKASSLMSGRILANLFFEPSTRTRMSFEAAMKRLGGMSIGFDNGELSSEVKGETIADAARITSGYADVIVLRHPVEGSARIAAEFSECPVINGGDGANQHPTQTLLDLYTIKKEFGRLDGLDVSIIGDLKYGRTVHSLASALGNYDVGIKFISPAELRAPRGMVKDLMDKGVSVKESSKLSLKDCDVAYVTRIQKERFPDPQEYVRVKDAFVLNSGSLESMRDGGIIMHPLPRVCEIAPEVDDSVHSRYFDQARNGIPVRMALLCLVSGVRFW